MNRTPVSLLIAASFLLLCSSLAGGHGPSPHKAAEEHSMSEEAMKAQHERMANFKKAADMVFDAIVHGAAKLAGEGADLLDESLKGHEQDVPHKNRSRAKEFQGLYVELGKRTKQLKAAVRAEDIPKSAVAYGRTLEICAACHRKFRD